MLTVDAQRVANIAFRAGLFPLVLDDGDVALLASGGADPDQAAWFLLPRYLHHGRTNLALVTPEVGDDGDPVLILGDVDAMREALMAMVPA